MKLQTSFIAIVAFAAGVIGAVVYPAVAQQTGSQSAWEVSFTRPSPNSGTVTFVKHNRVTGHTLVLTCVSNDCEKEQSWLELPEEAPE